MYYTCTTETHPKRRGTFMINILSEMQIRKATYPSVKSLSDGKGLSLEVTEKSKRFKFRYQRPINKKINNLVIGYYPATSLKSAREIAQEYRELLARGIDPQYKKRTDVIDFDFLAEQYLRKGKSTWSEKHYTTTLTRYLNYLKRPLGNRDASTITGRDIFQLLESYAHSGSYQTAEKLSYIINGAFSQGLILGYVQYNPSIGVMAQVTKTSKEKQMPHFNLTRPGEIERFSEFLIDINALKNTDIAVKTALVLSPHVFMRTGNLVSLKLSNFIKDERMFLIEADDMKMGHSDFIVPLSDQAFELVNHLIDVTKPNNFIFESRKTKTGHIARESLSKAKERAGWAHDDITIHGLRHTATTYLTECGFDYEVTEMQLHHKLHGVRGVYNKSVHLDKRREMMQFWSDFICKISNEAH